MTLKPSEAYFKRELDMFTNMGLKSCIIDILDNYILLCNYMNPSSGSGKYHPPKDNQGYGNLIHTKTVFKIALTLLETRDDLVKYKDVLLASCMLHDLCKYDSSNSKHTNKNHNKTVATLVRQYMKEKNIKDEHLYSDLEMISKVVYIHMGKYTKDENFYAYMSDLDYNEEQLAYLLHYSDYLASRKWFDIVEYSV